MKKILKTNSLILVLVVMFNMLFPVLSMATDANVTVTFQDANLYNAIVTELGSKVASKDDSSKTVTITQGNLETVTTLTLYNKNIENISGIEKFTYLTKLYLNVNKIIRHPLSDVRQLLSAEHLQEPAHSVRTHMQSHRNRLSLNEGLCCIRKVLTSECQLR